MRILLAACVAMSALAADNQLSSEERIGGWRLLFDGKSFFHWKPVSSYTIDGNCLKAVKHPPFREDLFSEDSYGDFELMFDWKISPAGNSGVKYRIQDHAFVDEKPGEKFEDEVRAAFLNRPGERPAHGQDYVVGFEYQITDNQTNGDAVHNGPRYQSAALYGVFAPSRDVTKPVGEFNRSRLVVRGNHIEHWLNGVKVVDANLDAPEVAAAMAKRWGEDSPVYKLLVTNPRKRGPISLQNHGDECWFKNIKIHLLE